MHDSAATGLYVGGEQTNGEVLNCRIHNNGHSGIYVQHAKLHSISTVITDNFLTGISVIGYGAFSIIENTTVKGNAKSAIESTPNKIEMRGKNFICDNPHQDF